MKKSESTCPGPSDPDCKLPSTEKSESSRPGPSDPDGKLHVLRGDGDPLSVDGAQLGVFEQTGEEGLSSLLYSCESRGSPTVHSASSTVVQNEI
jgi:hypothetical protein